MKRYLEIFFSMDNGIDCLRKILNKREQEINKYKQFLEGLFPNDTDYIMSSVDEFKVLLILDIPGFSKEENRKKRVDEFIKNKKQKKVTQERLTTLMSTIWGKYKTVFFSTIKEKKSRLNLLEQLRKMGILQFKIRVKFFKKNQKSDSKIELMTLDDFLSIYSLRRVKKVIDNIPELKWSLETKKQAFKQFRHFWSYLHEKYLGRKILHGNTKNHLGVVNRRPTNRFLEPSLTANLLKEIEMSNNIRNIILCRLIFYCGKEVSYEEISDIQVCQLDFENQQILFSSNIHIKLSNEFILLFKSYIGKKKKYIFRTINNRPIHRTYLERFIQKKARNIKLDSTSIETLQLSIEAIKSSFF